MMLGFSAGVKSTVKRLLAENGSSSIGGRYIPHLSAAVDQCLRYKSALPEPDSDSYYHSHNVDIPTTNNYNYLPQHILNGAHPPQPKLNIDIGMNGHRKPKLKKKSRKEIFYRHETQAQAQTQTPAVDHLSNILNARVYDVAKETPLQEAKNLSTHLNNQVFLKREDMQDVFSFKLRGAYNKMAHLSPEQLQQGVVCCSAGNHAQGVALSANRLKGTRAVIVMPETTPDIKVKAVRMHAGTSRTVQVKLYGQTFDESSAEAQRLQKEEGMTMIHPFDDPLVIAGQGTIGMEMLRQHSDLDVIFVCCGGGGLLAGVAAYVKRVRPSVKVIGVEAEDAAGMTTSLKAGRVVSLPTVCSFAGGAAVKTVGQEPFRICQDLVDDMITVSTDEICQAIKLSYNDARVVLEPAGALGVAGLTKYVQDTGVTGQSLAAITSGANMDFDNISFICSRSKED